MKHTFIHVKKLKVLDDYNLLLFFADGSVKLYDMKPELWGRLFEPLKDPFSFSMAFVESGTVKWPNGAEICHDKLYRNSSDARQELLQ